MVSTAKRKFRVGEIFELLNTLPWGGKLVPWRLWGGVKGSFNGGCCLIACCGFVLRAPGGSRTRRGDFSIMR